MNLSKSKKVSERSLKGQIKYYFDVSLDKQLLLVDILGLIDTNIIRKIKEEIKALKKVVTDILWYCCNVYEEVERNYDSGEFIGYEDNKGTIDTVSNSMGKIRAYEEILKLLGEKVE